jgi:hypothetical protein
LNTRLALGQPVDFSQAAQCVGAMVRVASRLGLQRRAKDVGPSLSQYLESIEDESAADAELRTDTGKAELGAGLWVSVIGFSG